jgi:hybrid polyketide synthase / nonribosomal peptide synthetase ACE1
MLRRWPELATDRQTVLQQASISFDLSWWTVLLGLSTRSKVVVAGSDIRGDPRALTRIIITHGITVTVATPSESLSWLQSVDDAAELRASSWRWHIAGGEPFSLALLRQLYLHDGPSLRVINAFGPAECWMPLAHEVFYQQTKSMKEAESLWPIPLGTVMPNYTVRIVDKSGHALPADMPGQLVIGGAGVARGYVNQAELTAQRFPGDRYPMSAHSARGWDKAHLSGDYGYLSAKDGVFVMLGRIEGDTQVKLRGLRLDLRDVEASIMAQAHGYISEVVMSVRQLGHHPSSPSPSLASDDSSTSCFLVAHAVLGPSVNINYPTADKRAEFLRTVVSELPLADYMRPTVIIPVEALPLTPNGKLDRRAIAAWPVQLGLKPHESASQRIVHEHPSPAREGSRDMEKAESDLRVEKIKQIWLQTLGSSIDLNLLQSLDPQADFFHVGGNSILLTKVQTQLRRQYGVDVPLRELFHSSTLGQMASILEQEMPDTALHGVNWEQEAQPPLELSLAVQVAKLSPVTSESPGAAIGRVRRLVVALTGATGFLGRNIVRQLIEHPDVAEVHCLAVRSSPTSLLAENEGVADARNTKLVIHAGDLSQPNLGIAGAAELESLFSRADVIIHNGADTSFLKSYATLRPANLDSLKTLVRLSLTHRTIAPPKDMPRRRPAHVHFVSTAGVATFLGRDLGEEPLGRTPPPQVTEGYLLTKWAGELFVERAVAASDGLLRATVHRPTAISGPGAPELDVVSSVMRYSEVLGAVPALEGYAGKIQFVPVEEVVAGVIAAAVDDGGAAAVAADTVQYRNHCGADPKRATDLDRLGEYLRQKLERSEPIPVVGDKEWITRAEAAGFPKLLGEYLRADTLGGKGKRKTFRILLKS